MGRLENIIARNRGWHRPSERSLVSLVFGLIVVVILVMAAATGLGTTPGASAPAGAPAADRARGVDGVLLRTPPRPLPPPAQ